MSKTANDTIARPRTPDLTVDQRGLLTAWLKHHDRQLYGAAVLYRDAAARATADLEFAVAIKHVRELAGACRFWKHLKGLRRSAKFNDFTPGEWAAMAGWVRRNQDDIDSRLDTAHSVARRMRHGGVVTSVRGAIEATAAEGINLGWSPAKFELPKPAAPEKPAAKKRARAKKTADQPAQTLSPVRRQYQQFKDQHPGYVLFFRVGDFYEMFADDAVIASRVLGVTLTTRRETGKPDVPMAGVPFHAVEGYLRKMIAAGHRVALCEQVGEGERQATLRAEQPAPPTVPATTAAEKAVPLPPAGQARVATTARVITGLRAAGVPYVEVDEAKRALFAQADLGAFDLVVYSALGPNWLLLCEPPTAANRPAMDQWNKVFGDGFRTAFTADAAGGGDQFVADDGTPLPYPITTKAARQQMGV